jgi:preprotein translocase subunit SecY
VLGLGLIWVSDLIREVGVGDGVMLKVVVRLWEGGFWDLACAEEWGIGNSTYGLLGIGLCLYGTCLHVD